MRLPLNSSDTSIRTFADTFTTFLYAAAIHLIVGEFVQHPETKTLANVGLLVFIIVFLLFDWLSRVRLPHLVEDTPLVWQQLSKAFLEVTGLVFLIYLAVLLISNPQVNWQPYAVAFLFVSVLWNVIQMKVMKELDVWPLIKAILAGTVVEMKAVREYAEKFLKFKKMVKSEFDKMQDPSEMSASMAARFRKFTTASYGGMASLLWEVGWRTFAQYVGIHLALANFTVGLLVAAHFFTGEPVFWPLAYTKVVQVAGAYGITALLVIAPVICIVTNIFRLKRRCCYAWLSLFLGIILALAVLYKGDHPLARMASLAALLVVAPAVPFAAGELSERPWFKLAGATLSWAVWSLLALLVPVDTLLIGLASESIVVNAFLQVVTGDAEPGAAVSATA